MADHQHVQVLVQRVRRVGAGRVGRRREYVRQAGDLDDVGGVAAAGTLGVEGMNGAALEGGDGVFHEAGLVQRVGVDHHLDIVTICDRQRAIDGGGRGAPILVQFQAGRAGAQHFLQRLRLRRVALAGERQIDR